ncbi:unnamed protein product, partial [marine sediment metagenome]
LYLPAQGASETEATIIEWTVAAGDVFAGGDVLAQVDSAKSVFDFEAPCDGRVIQLFYEAGEAVQLTDPVLEIETSDAAMRDWIPPAAEADHPATVERPVAAVESIGGGDEVAILGVGGYLPERVVTNADLVKHFPEISEQYVYQVTGIRQRRWVADGEKPSDMAYAAALEAIRNSGIGIKDIDAIVLSTTTPDVAMPSTACILQDRLGLEDIPAFDINAACCGWLYAVSTARGLILSNLARTVLVV